MAKLTIALLFARMMLVGRACNMQYPECQKYQSRQEHGPEKSISHAISLGIILRKYIIGRLNPNFTWSGIEVNSSSSMRIKADTIF